jgi:hypothetical protein
MKRKVAAFSALAIIAVASVGGIADNRQRLVRVPIRGNRSRDYRATAEL